MRYARAAMFRSLLSLTTRTFASSTTKYKTNSAASKRFRHLLSGDYSYTKSCRNHNFAKKSCPRRTGIRQEGLTEGWQSKMLQRMQI